MSRIVVIRRKSYTQMHLKLGKNKKKDEHGINCLKDAWNTKDASVRWFEEKKAAEILEVEPEKKSAFRIIREGHNISLEELVGDIDGAIAPGAITCFDLTGRGTSFVIEACLDSLSALSGKEYTRENVGGIVELPFLRKKRDKEPMQTGPEVQRFCCSN